MFSSPSPTVFLFPSFIFNSLVLQSILFFSFVVFLSIHRLFHVLNTFLQFCIFLIQHITSRLISPPYYNNISYLPYVTLKFIIYSKYDFFLNYRLFFPTFKHLIFISFLLFLLFHINYRPHLISKILNFCSYYFIPFLRPLYSPTSNPSIPRCHFGILSLTHYFFFPSSVLRSLSFFSTPPSAHSRPPPISSVIPFITSPLHLFLAFISNSNVT